MDIFSRIDEQATVAAESAVVQSTGGIIEKDGKYGYAFVPDISKYDVEYEHLIARTMYTGEGFFAEKRAERFYKFLFKPQKKCKSNEEYEKRNAKRTQKILKMLKRGINFDYFSTGMRRAVLEKLSEQDIKILYQNGFDIQTSLTNLYNTSEVLAKKIYYGVTEFPPYILRNIPTKMLEKLIYTRSNLELSEQNIQSFIGNYYYNTAAKSVSNIQLLIKTGQIFLSPEQICDFCNFAEKEGFKIAPEVEALRKVALTKIPQEVAEKKYTTQRHLVRKKEQPKKEKPKSEAQEAIDKLFEDAQKASE